MALLAFLLLCCAFAATLQPNGTISLGQPKNVTLAEDQYTWLTIDLNSVGANQGLRVDVTSGVGVAMGFRWAVDLDSDSSLSVQLDELTEYNFGDDFVRVNTLIIPACGFVNAAPNNKMGNLVFGSYSNFGNTSSVVTVSTYSETCTVAAYNSTALYPVAGFAWTYVDVPFTVSAGCRVTWKINNQNGLSTSVNTYASYVLSEYPDKTYPTGTGTYDRIYLVQPQMTIRLGIWNDAGTDLNVSVNYTTTPITCSIAACTGGANETVGCEEVTTCVGARHYESYPTDSFFDPRDAFMPLMFLTLSSSSKCRLGLANTMCAGLYTPCDENNFLRPLCAEPFCNDLSGCVFTASYGALSQSFPFPNLSNLTQCVALLNRGQPDDSELPDFTSGVLVGREYPMNFVAGDPNCYTPPNAHVNAAFSQGVNRFLIGTSIFLAAVALL